MTERLPRFTSSDELFGVEARAEARSTSHSASEFGVPSTLRTAPPADVPIDGSDLDIQLRAYLECLGLDGHAFDDVLRRYGFAAGALQSATNWANEALYVSLTRALEAVSRSYVFNGTRRPRQGFRESLVALGRREGSANIGRAIVRLALGFDPVYWSRSDGPGLSLEELDRGCELWGAFVRRADAAGDGLPWGVALTLELSMHAFRALLADERRGGGESTLARRDVLRAALSETNPMFAVYALTAFLVANSVEIARALDPYDEPRPDL